MNKDRILILDKERIARKIHRMAYQAWEYNSNEKSVTLIGIESAGAVLANNLAKTLREISPLNVEVISININKRKPLTSDTIVDTDLTGRSVILVDDVADSGRTLLYALRPLLSYEMKKILIAVLVDRKHKSYPVSADIVGHSIATTLQEHIEVEHENGIITAAYLQ
ncbi:MAG: phosphoribosyltransferase [Taibaiella sp.]|nr:phosphoribosyltransferase [Taibaiella sp.]